MSVRYYRSRASTEIDARWVLDARCRQDPNPDRWFALSEQSPAQVQELMAICHGCIVRWDCLNHAMTFPEYHGIWGGIHPYVRARARRLGMDTDEVLAVTG